MTHHVQRCYLHLDLRGTEAEGLALHRQLPALSYDYLLPALERVLDRHAPPGSHLVINELTIDVGTLPLEQLETALAAAVAQALDQALQNQPPAAAAPPAAGGGLLKTEAQALGEAFLHFLRTGRLPWPFRLPAGRSLEQLMLAAWPVAQLAPAGHIGADLRSLLATAPVRQRLLKQFSATFRGKLLAELWPAGKQLLDSILTPLQQVGREPLDAPLLAASVAFESRLWEVLLARLATDSAATAEEIIRETWQRLASAGPLPAALADLLARHWPSSMVPTADTRPSASRLVSEKSTAAQQPAVAADSRPLNGLAADLADAEGYYLDNAGLVLLHPFLPRFFEALGLVEQDQLRQPERALGLLHYLATGQLTAPEHELTLPKVLCGVPLDAPVAADVALTPAETDEADALLAAVVRHWEALRNTSPDGLRGTFLVRPGKLARRPDGDWQLQVEPQSYDILLAQLPWSFSLIQLPWMPQLLRTEWD